MLIGIQANTRSVVHCAPLRDLCRAALPRPTVDQRDRRRRPGVRAVCALLAWLLTAALSAGAQELRVRPNATAHAPCRPLTLPPEDEADPWSVKSDVAAGSLVVGDVTLDKRDIFDVEEGGEARKLYRLANQLHVTTRDDVIFTQLLFASGEPFDARLLQESERLLRLNRYFFDAAIRPVRLCGNRVDIEVVTREVWTLNPGFSLSRQGGRTEFEIELEELNLMGTGSRVSLELRDDVDRRSTTFEYSDAQVGNTWVGLGLRLADSDDGRTVGLSVERPFYALDSRWAAGVSYVNDNRLEQLFDRGEAVAQYRQRTRFVRAYRGFSKGLRDGWVSRWSLGVTFDELTFSEAPTPALIGVQPRNRTLAYPYVAWELLEDRFNVTRNLRQIGRSEDIFLGTRLAASLGVASSVLGSDRGSTVFDVDGRTSFGTPQKQLLQVSGGLSGRYESGSSQNLRLGVEARYSLRQSDKMLFSAVAAAIRSHAPDLNEPLELGGDQGLRGFPLRYQSGSARAVMTLEQRYFTDWYPWRLARVGVAVFADVGRAWGPNPIGGPSVGWLKDVGVGLRLAPTRNGSRKILNLDLAFPIGAPADIDTVQISVESRRGF